MKTLLGALAVLVVAVLVTGWLLPERHVASGRAAFSAAPAEVWQAVSDYRTQGEWRDDVVAVEVVPGANGRTLVREVDADGETLTYAIVESEPPRRLVRRIADESLPFGGTWTFEIEALDTGSRLTITEHGEVYNPVFRFVSRFVLGHTASIEHYLAQLRRHLERGGG